IFEIEATTAVSGVFIEAGCTLTLTGTAAVDCDGNFINNATFNANTSTVTLNASSGTQTVGGSATISFYNLTLSNAGTRQFGNNASAKTFTVSNTLTWNDGSATVGQAAVADKLNCTLADSTV